MDKSPRDERRIIVEQPGKRPYGVRVRIQIQTATSIGDFEELCLPLETGAFLTVSSTRSAPWEGGRKYVVSMEGFATAVAAESAGKKLALCLLWTSISLDLALRIEYETYEPAAVFERNRSDGFRVEGFGSVGWSTERVLGELLDAHASLSEQDPRLVLSMEIFAGARIETSERARFLAVVSALEPLADEQDLGPEVGAYVDDCLERLNAQAIPETVKRSLQGRLRHLRRESIRQALHRVIQASLPEFPEAVATVDQAYALRSEVVHSGRPADLDVDLAQERRKVSAIIRRVYSQRLGRTLTKETAG